MSFLVKLGLIFSVFASWASCFTKFIRPPERDPDQAADQDMTKNNHYDDGQTIPILFDTNIKKVDLYIWQFIDAEKNATSLLESDGTSDPTGWKAQYDISNATENNEDCIYWFSLIDSKYGGTLAKSQYVNVSAPKAEETTTDSSASGDASSTLEPSSKSGLSRGEIAGVAVGATIGGLLILGCVGWMVWRRRARMKNNAALAELPGNYNQDQPHSERPKSELPAEPVVFPSERPRSPPRIYEAP
ncbi:hypothetical protein FOMG_05900 [Fusarium oxysporum f. sp. melonis 26406]|uniref:Mid2 domain-containing protein n=4 Tax=Fusarium oxysporum TaxID=5507 RepID=A0A2H3HH54_FUSOX|nr:hypothetical protein FOMG_05900 [Fusarium oxysporum f. sp. melonis 26406]KAJ9424582.1 hypothetical protein QL093DRAFT_2219069 [Fusarium oxysporum]PCD37253.1 hypothetical protein AU210_005756 [Fusarium oxysporum f. sp. radicis-cucumerinum]RKL21277.1 hypothetical protein BFJ68_g2545 [Fusarium oxysporum]